MSKCCGNCKYFKFEDIEGNGICEIGEILLPHCSDLDCPEWIVHDRYGLDDNEESEEE